MDGKYSLIAGHIDGNESVMEAIIRGAHEEGGLKLTPNDLTPATMLHRKNPDQEYIDFFFIVNNLKQEPFIGEPDKCDELRWFPIDNLPENTLHYIKEALDNFKNQIPFSETGWK